MLRERQHIIILSVYEHSRNSFVSGPGAVILQQTSRVKMILTQVILSLQALTSSFGYNYLPHSGIPLTFVTKTPALPNEINLSYFSCWILFLPVTDLILIAQQSTVTWGLLFICILGVPFFCRAARLQAYLCEWSLHSEITSFSRTQERGPSTPAQTWHRADRFSSPALTLHHLNYGPFQAPLTESLPNEPSFSGGND